MRPCLSRELERWLRGKRARCADERVGVRSHTELGVTTHMAASVSTVGKEMSSASKTPGCQVGNQTEQDT